MPKPTRRQLFLAGLELTPITLKEWCRHHDVTDRHLYFVLDGERTPSAKLMAAIEATIARVQHAAALAGASQ